MPHHIPHIFKNNDTDSYTHASGLPSAIRENDACKARISSGTVPKLPWFRLVNPGCSANSCCCEVVVEDEVVEEGGGSILLLRALSSYQSQSCSWLRDAFKQHLPPCTPRTQNLRRSSSQTSSNPSQPLPIPLVVFCDLRAQETAGV